MVLRDEAILLKLGQFFGKGQTQAQALYEPVFNRMDLEYICSLVQTICNGLFFCLQALFAFSFCSAHNQFTDFLIIFCLLNKVTNRVMKKLLDYESLLIKVVILRKQNCFRQPKLFVLYSFRNRANPGEVSTDSRSLAKI